MHNRIGHIIQVNMTSWTESFRYTDLHIYFTFHIYLYLYSLKINKLYSIIQTSTKTVLGRNWKYPEKANTLQC